MKFKDRIIGIVAAPGFDDFQVLAIARLLENRDASILIIGVGEGTRLAVYGQSGTLLKPDTTLSEVTADDIDALVIPTRSTQNELVTDDGVMTLLIGLNAMDKPIGAIGSGQLVLAAAGLLEGRRITVDEGSRGKIEEAGAVIVDQELVVDRNIVTTRSGDPLKHFVDVIAFLLEPAQSLS